MSGWCRRALRLAILVGALVLLRAANAQEAQPAPAPAKPALVAPNPAEPLRFRRVYVPADRFDELAKDTIPLRRERFEEMIAAFSDDPTAVQGSRIDSCQLAARLTGQRFQGLGRIQVRHADESSQYLSLAPCRLPISTAWWSEDYDELLLGYDPQGSLAGLVDRSGLIDFQWELSGTATGPRTHQFALTLPASPLNRVLFITPADCQLSSDSGMLRRLERNRLEVSEDPEWNWWEDTPGDDETLWLLELGGTTQLTLQMQADDLEPDSARLPGYRQNTHYELSPRDTSVMAEVFLDRPVEPLSSLEINWSSELNLTSATWDLQDLRWEEGPIGKNRRTARVHLPRGVAFGGIPISLGFRGTPIRNGLQALPTVELTSAAWREGQATLRLQDPLVLTQLELAQCLLESTPPDGKAVNESPLNFRMLSPLAELRVRTQLQQPIARATAATLLAFEPEGIRGKFHAEVSSSQGSLFQIDAQLGPNWTVDSVEATHVQSATSETSDALRDWNLVTGGSQGQRLEIRLAQPLKPDRPLRLTVLAHQRTTTLEGNLSLRELAFLELDDVSIDQQLFAWRADSALTLELESAGSSRVVQPQELTEAIGSWYAKETAAEDYPLQLLAEETTLPAIELSLRRARPRYTGAIESFWRVAPQSIAAAHKIVCQPQSGSIAKLLFRTSAKQQPPLSWSMEGDGNTVVTPQLLHEDLEGTIWELDVYPPRSKAFTLLAEQQLPKQDNQRLGLITLPEAIAQTGLIEVQATTAEVSYRLRARGLMVAPLVAGGDHRELLYARYRYQSGEPPQLDLVADDTLTRGDLLQVWQLRVESLVTSDRILHSAMYLLENRGENQFTATLPGKVQLREVWINGLKLDAAAHTPERSVTLPLSPGQRFVSVRLVYEAPKRDRWSLWRRFEAQVPRTEWSPLQASWRLRVSPEIAVWRSADLARMERDTPWYTKMFGPLASDPRVAPPSEAQAAEEHVDGLALADSPWWPATDSWGGDSRDIGWPQVELPLSEGQAAGVTLTKPAGWQILSTGLLLISAALSLLICRRKARRIVLILGLTGSLCLLAPSMCSVAGCGLFLGSLLAAAWLSVVQLRGPVTDAFAPSSSQEASTATAANYQLIVSWLLLSATVAAGGMAVLGTMRALAQEPAVIRRPIYPVFIPVNDQEQPQGNYVHLQESFYKALHRRYIDHRSPPVGWLLHSAEYSCQLTLLADQAASLSPIEVEELQFEGEISILRSDTKLTLPFRSDQLALVEGTAFLGGNPVQPVWSEDGQSLQIPPQATGQYQLELRFRPRIALVSGRNVMQVNVPPAAQARVTIIHSTGVEDFRLRPPVPLVSVSMQRTVAELGPVSAWELELPQSPERDRALAAEQLTWLHVKPGATIWDVKCRYTPTVGSTHFVEWEVDPNLRLLTLSVDGAEYARHSRYPQSRLLNIQLIEPVSEPFTVDAKFIQEESHGIGRLRLPLLRVLGAQQDRRWLAVSAANSIRTTIAYDELVEPLPASEFLTAWQSEVDSPDQAFRLLSPQPQWSVVVVPQPKLIEAQAWTTLSLDTDAVTLEYEVNLAPQTEAQPLYQFQVPAGFRVQSAKLHAADQSQELHPALEDEHLLLMVPEPVAAEHRLTLKLRGPPAGESYLLPMVSMEGVSLRSEEYRVFRHSDLNLEFPEAEPRGSSFASADLTHYSHQWGSLAGVFRHDAEEVGQPWPLAMVSPNRPVVEQGELIMALAREDGAWLLNLTLRGHVERGLLDALRLVAPNHLPPPVISSPAVSLETISLSDDTREQWVFHSAEPWRDDLLIELSIPLEFEPGVSPRLPVIEVLDNPQWATFLVLPKQVNHQEAAWTVIGLEPVEPPQPVEDRPWLSSLYDCYRATGEYSASLRLESPQRLEPQVRLADVQVVVQANRHFHGTVAFDLEPGGLSTCLLELPAGLTLEQVLLDGGAIAVQAGEASAHRGQSYQCLLGEANLPHRLEVLFSGTGTFVGGGGESRLRVPVPRLPEVPVERTLWTILPPASTALAENSSSVSAIELQRHWEYRLQAAAILAEPPTQLLSSVAKGDLATWYVNWADRLAAYYQAGRESVVEGEEYEYPLDEDFLRERREMATRMGLAKQFQSALDKAEGAASKPRPWQLTQLVSDSRGSSVAPIYAMSQGAAEPLELSIASPQVQTGRNWLPAALLLAATLGGYWLLRNRSMTEWTVWWLHPAGVLLGIIWWLYLTPAAVGWLIIGVSLIGSLRSPWRMRTVDQRRAFAGK